MHLLLANNSAAGGAGAGAFEAIASQTLGSDTATITFSSIPSTYQHLQIRYLSKSTTTGLFGTSIDVRLNSDSGSNYTRHLLFGDGASITTSGSTSQTSIRFLQNGCESSTADIFGVGIIDIYDYASTSKYTTVRTMCGWDANGSGVIGLDSGLWLSTSAVTSVTLGIGNFNTSYKAGSVFALYGIKG